MKELTFDQIISECTKHIIANHMLFAGKAITLPHVIDNSIDTAATNGLQIKYNEAYLNGLIYKQRVTLMCHELLHVYFAHHLRLRGRDHELWNVACDYVINLILVQMGFEALDNWLYNPKYKGMSAEDIYNTLKQQPKEDQEQQKQQSKESGGEFSEPTNSQGEDMTPEELSKELQKAATDAQKGADMLDRRIKGIEKSESLKDSEKQSQLQEIGAGINEVRDRLTDIRKSNLDWKAIVRQFLFDEVNCDYDDQELDLDEMFIHDYDIILPDVVSEAFGDVALCLDVSGSLSHQAKQVASEAFHALEEVNKGELLLYHISTYIHSKKVIKQGEDIEEIHGGGTNFDPFFNTEVANGECNAKAIIFVTDGEVSFNRWVEPEVPVLWVLTKANVWFENNVPFGECVRLNS